MKWMRIAATVAALFILFLCGISQAQSYDSGSAEEGWEEMDEMDKEMDVQPGDAMAPETGEMDVQPGDAIDSEGLGAH